jgi:hypothetical protein
MRNQVDSCEGGWTMSMAWMRMPRQTWSGAAAIRQAQERRVLPQVHRHALTDSAQQFIRNGVGPHGDFLDRQPLAP